MAQSAPRVIFGVHTWTPYSRTTGEFLGSIRVLSSSSVALTGELIKLNGGSQRYAWEVEDGLINAELALSVKEYPDFLMELFLGKAPTSNSAESGGSVTALANKKGTSTVDATTGIASVGVKSGSEVDVKFGQYLVKVTSATTVDVFASTDADFQRGADKEFENDALKITASALTIVASTPTEVPGFGIELTGGSGAIGMTIGDTAEFEARPINDESTDLTFGATADIFPEFGSIVIGQKRGNGEMFEVELFRCKGIGMPLGFTAKEFSEAELTIEAFYDSVLNAVGKIRHVKPSTIN